MSNRMTSVQRAVALMREAQAELDRAGHAAAAAHLETALGFAEAEMSRQPDLATVRAR